MTFSIAINTIVRNKSIFSSHFQPSRFDDIFCRHPKMITIHAQLLNLPIDQLYEVDGFFGIALLWLVE